MVVAIENKSNRKSQMLGCGVTVNEMMVLRLLVAGKSQKEVAATLGIGYPNVGKHVHLAMKRNGCGTCEQLIYKLMKQGAL